MSNKLVPPPQKGRFSYQYRGVRCTNCLHPLDISDRFCPNCGQANSTKKPSLKDFIDEFFASLISYDSRLLKTLSALLSKPGKITQDYLEGKRISYTNPFRFLLSLAIVYFLMVNFSNNFSNLDQYGVGQKKSIFERVSSIELSDEGFILDSTAINYNEKALAAALDSLEIIAQIKKKDSLILQNPKSHYTSISEKEFLERFGEKREFFGTLLKEKEFDSFEATSKAYDIPSSRENRAAFNAAKSVIRLQTQPGSFLNSIIAKLPFLVFFFLPLFSCFIWLIYVRKNYTYTEHLVFSFHNQSLFFILLIISFVIDSIFGIYTIWLFFLIFAIYLFFAMRRFYQQGFFKTLVKYVFLNTIFLILALLAVVLLFTGSAFTY